MTVTTLKTCGYLRSTSIIFTRHYGYYHSTTSLDQGIMALSVTKSDGNALKYVHTITLTLTNGSPNFKTFILPLPLSPRPRPFGASSTNKVSRGKLSGRIKYLMLFPRILSESKAVGSRPFIVIFTAFRCVFMDTSTPTV